MSFVAFVTAGLLASRDSERTAAELLRASPATKIDRTLALAVAGTIPVALTAATMVILRLLIVRADGIELGDGDSEVVPSSAYLAGPVLVVGVSWVLGIAAARTVSSRVLILMVGLLGSYLGNVMFWIWAWFPAFFLMPYASPLSSVDLGGRLTYEEAARVEPRLFVEGHWHRLVLQEDRVIWHSCYLVGLALLLLAYACWRSGPGRRLWWVALVGLALAVAGFIGQVLSWGGEVEWFEAVLTL